MSRPQKTTCFLLSQKVLESNPDLFSLFKNHLPSFFEKPLFLEKPPLIPPPSSSLSSSNLSSLKKRILKEEGVKNVLLCNLTEAQKTIDTIHEWVMTLGDNIEDVVCLGGGLIFDMGGFLASLYGAKSHYLSTTLLSSLDAGVGGKTGVNLPFFGKNQIGTFYLPTTFISLPQTFQSLSFEERLSGLYEGLKHEWIFGGFETYKKEYEALLESPFDFEMYKKVILRNITYKLSITQKDMKEEGLRKVLNFGHTLGHVLESLHYETSLFPSLPHGVCVGYGMVFVLSYLEPSFFPLHSKKGFLDFLEKVLASHPLPSLSEEGMTIVLPLIQKLLLQDKKNDSPHTISFVVPPYGFFNMITSSKNSFQEEMSLEGEKPSTNLPNVSHLHFIKPYEVWEVIEKTKAFLKKRGKPFYAHD
jgi:3-dehydroquinate synthase